MRRSMQSRGSMEEAFTSSTGRPPWGGSAVNEAIRLATRCSTRSQLEHIGEYDCADLIDDVYEDENDEGDLESTLVRESFKHGVLVDSATFYELLRSDDGFARKKWFILIPNSRFSLYWGICITVFTLIFCGLIQPFVVGFDYKMRLTRHGGGSHLSTSAMLEFFAGLVFFADTVIQLFEAKPIVCRATGRRTLITNPRLIAQIYWQSYFLSDALANVPLLVQIVASCIGESHKVARLTRLLRMLRIFRLLSAQHVTGMEILFMKMFTVTPMVIFVVQILSSFVVLIHVCACMFIYVALSEDRANSWLSLVDDLPFDASDAQIYATALYFATATITTVGFGDIGAVNSAERVVVTFSMLVGALAFAYLVGAIASAIQLYSIRTARQRHYRQFVTRVHAFLDRQHAPIKLRRHILSYCSEVYPRRMFFKENESLLSILPSDLQNSIAHHMLRPSLQRIWGDMPESLSRRLAALFEIECIEPGVVLRQDMGFFIVTEGAIVVSFVGLRPKVAAVLTPGNEYLSYHGINALTPQTQRTPCKVSTLTVCEIWKVTSDEKFRDTLSRYPHLVEKMIAKLTRRTLYDQDDLLDEREAVLKDFLRDLSAARDI